jgi:hypothetical protein
MHQDWLQVLLICTMSHLDAFDSQQSMDHSQWKKQKTISKEFQE